MAVFYYICEAMRWRRLCPQDMINYLVLNTDTPCANLVNSSEVRELGTKLGIPERLVVGSIEVLLFYVATRAMRNKI